MNELPKRSAEARELSRREAIGLIGVASVATLAGCVTTAATNGASGAPANGNTMANANSPSANANTAAPSCIVTPEATEGPYFVDEMLNRSDIRSDPSDGSVEGGVPLRLRMTVSQVNGSECTPLAGAMVDVWHCNANGDYSDVEQNGTVGEQFLRGFQVTDADGVVEFTTIYPGWYSGRTVHIHFKVRTDSVEFNSQLYFDEALTAQVYAQSPYAARGSPDTTNDSDTIFNEQTLLTLTPEGDGYFASFDIGLRMS